MGALRVAHELAIRPCPPGKGKSTMTRKDSINKMRELLVTRRNALRKALAGDLSLLKQLREQTGGDVVDLTPRYNPWWSRWLLHVPLVREVVTWNLVIVLRKR